MILAIAFAAFVSTLVGGLFALRFRDKLHLILGFSAGAVIGVAFFDLLPESIELGQQFFDVATVTQFVTVGFLLYLLLDRTIFFHSHSGEEGVEHASTHRGILGAGSLCFHSFLDGVAIGLAFQVSAAIGAVVTAAVLVHDFSDGINTVNLVLKNGGSWKQAFRWLIIDAVAPLLGAASTLLLSISESTIGLVLAVFVGTFLYLSASDLIPESHHRHPRALTTFMTLFGALVIYTVVSLV